MDSISEHLGSIDNSLHLLSLFECFSRSEDIDLDMDISTGKPVSDDGISVSIIGSSWYKDNLKKKIQNAIKVVLGYES